MNETKVQEARREAGGAGGGGRRDDSKKYEHELEGKDGRSVGEWNRRGRSSEEERSNARGGSGPQALEQAGRVR